jgi:hypothetical protein
MCLSAVVDTASATAKTPAIRNMFSGTDIGCHTYLYFKTKFNWFTIICNYKREVNDGTIPTSVALCEGYVIINHTSSQS